jgi:cell division protein ZapD
MPRESALDHHFALITLFEILEVASRPELKSDVLKDLDRQKQVMNGYRGNPAISEQALDLIVDQLETNFEALNALAGKIGSSLGENDFLNSLKSRVVIPAGTCEFDLPAYHAWQHSDATKRQADLHQWSACFVPISKSIQMLLKMLRDSGSAQKVMATAGQLQQNLPQGRTFQLLRLRIDPSLNLVPEISCNRLLVVIRLMQQQTDGRLVASAEDTAFEMTLCA